MKSPIPCPGLAAALATGGLASSTGTASARGDGSSAEFPFGRASDRPEAIGRHHADRSRDRIAAGS